MASPSFLARGPQVKSLRGELSFSAGAATDALGSSGGSVVLSAGETTGSSERGGLLSFSSGGGGGTTSGTKTGDVMVKSAMPPIPLEK